MRRLLVLAACCSVALAAWPTFFRHAETASAIVPTMTSAPLIRDDLTRSQVIAFWEARDRAGTASFMAPAHLASEYLQRFREHGDPDDVTRSIAAARRSIAMMPRRNLGPRMTLATALVAKHDFAQARSVIRETRGELPTEPLLAFQEAGVDLELGMIPQARAIFDRYPASPRTVLSRNAPHARYLELTGHLDQARSEFAEVVAIQDTYFDAPAQARASLHVRAAELAFAAGATPAAFASIDAALARYPDEARAYTVRARMEAALGRWNDAGTDAAHAVALMPDMESYGLAIDAARATHPGDVHRAQAMWEAAVSLTRAAHVNDRLVAVYESEHGIHLGDALTIARDDVARRPDPYSEDTLAAADIALGRWNDARTAVAQAQRYGCADPRISYHAGLIAEHDANRVAAARLFAAALARNPSFAPRIAADARAHLAADRPTTQVRRFSRISWR